jgi:hypothetical protein
MRAGPTAAAAGFSGRYTRFIALIILLGTVETMLWIRFLTAGDAGNRLGAAETIVALVAGTTAVAALIAMKRNPLLPPTALGNHTGAGIAAATHRAGHVVATWLDAPAALTATSLHAPCRRPRHHGSATQTTLQIELSILLGGIAAQELFAGEMTTTAAPDLSWATALGADYVGRYGMGGSPLSLAVATTKRRRFLGRVLDDPRTRKDLESLLRDTKRDLARRLLQQRHVVIAVRDALLRKGALTRSQILDVIRTAENAHQNDAVLVDIRNPHDRSGSLLSVVSDSHS